MVTEINIHFIPWVLTCIFLMILPGPDMALVTKWTLAKNTKSGWLAVAGIMSAFLLYSCLIILGLGNWIFEQKTLLELMRILGGSYLIYLGLISFKHISDAKLFNDNKLINKNAFKTGIISNLLNPKQTLFLIVLLPQFTSDGSQMDLLVLLVIMGIISLLFWLVWIILLSLLGQKLNSHHKWVEIISSVTLIILGVLIIFKIF